MSTALDDLTLIRRHYPFRMLRAVLPVIAVLALIAIDVGVFVLHAYRWVWPISIEEILGVIALDVLVTVLLASMFVSLAILRDSWGVLVVVAASLLAAIGVTAFNLWCASMAALHAG